MKKIIAIALISASFSANAFDYCKYVESAAEAVMEFRQSSLPASKAIEITISSKGTGHSDFADDLYKRLIIDAYSRPIVPEGLKKKEISEFSSFHYVSCIRNSI